MNVYKNSIRNFGNFSKKFAKSNFKIYYRYILQRSSRINVHKNDIHEEISEEILKEYAKKVPKGTPKRCAWEVS